MKSWIKMSYWILGILVGILISIWIAFQVSPYPSALIIRRSFSLPVEIKDKEAYQKAEAVVQLTQNHRYTSRYESNTFDLYLPKGTQGKIPVFLWVHGGGFVGGDKSGMREFSTYISADSQMAVVSMNYEVAPELTYPGQVRQVSELVTYLKKHTADYPQLDMSRVIIGGDSAGSQIAGQYALIQTNESYAKENQFTPTLDKQALLGFISYCGPVNLVQIKEEAPSSRIMKWFVQTVGWSLLGNKKWQDSEEINQASLVAHVTKEFPKTYLTDGNSYSFQEQGQSLDKKLQELGVPVRAQFYTNEKKTITHEFQFNYDKSEAKQVYQQTTAFIQSLQNPVNSK